MIKYLLLLFSAFLSMVSIAQLPKEKTLLWQISRKGIAQPSYLFGTIHIMCPDDLKVPEIVRAKFATTRQLYLELDMDDPGLMMNMMTGMIMKDTALDDLLPVSTFDSLNNIFRSRTGFPLAMMKKMQPILLMSLVYPSIMDCQPESWEKVFEGLAKEKQMEIKGLEELSTQIDVLNKIPYAVQAEMLVKTMFNLDSSKLALDNLLKVYREKDLNTLTRMTTSDDDFGEYEGVLLNDRNRNWVPVIESQVSKIPTFFAFGAGHLGGENGVINLLRKRGYQVKAIMF